MEATVESLRNKDVSKLKEALLPDTRPNKYIEEMMLHPPVFLTFVYHGNFGKSTLL